MPSSSGAETWTPMDLLVGLCAPRDPSTYRISCLRSQRRLQVFEQLLRKLERLIKSILPQTVNLKLQNSRIPEFQPTGTFVEIRLSVFDESVQVILPADLVLRITEQLMPANERIERLEMTQIDVTALSYLITKILAAPELYNSIRVYLCSVNIRSGALLFCSQPTESDHFLEACWVTPEEQFRLWFFFGEQMNARLNNYARALPGCLPEAVKGLQVNAELTVKLRLASLGSLLLAAPGEVVFPFDEEEDVALQGVIRLPGAIGGNESCLHRIVQISPAKNA